MRASGGDRPRRRALGAGLALAVAVLAGAGSALAAPAPLHRVQDAQPASAKGELTGVLARIRRSGVVRLGYREQAPPFSQGRPGTVPHGYSIDLCLAIVEEIADATGGRPLRVEYRVVTPGDRLERVVAGEIDLECGATSQTAERRSRVAFSPPIFVSGTRLAAPRSSAIRSRGDLEGRRIAVASGTTNEQVLSQLIAKGGLHSTTTVVAVPDLEQAFGRVDAGQADLVASDEVLLLGYLAQAGLRAKWNLLGELLSLEPYGLVYARDDAPLAAVVEAAFRRLARSRELRWIYLRWFERQLPSGVRLGLPMGPELRNIFELMGMPPE